MTKNPKIILFFKTLHVIHEFLCYATNDLLYNFQILSYIDFF